MNNGGDAAEIIVRLYLEGFEEVVKLSGKGIKELVSLLASTLKQESKTKGKARLTQMIKSGSPLKVFTFKNKDLKKFTEQAKRYGVLYTVLRDKNSNDPNDTVDVIARAEDASKIQRIADRFEFSKVVRLYYQGSWKNGSKEREVQVDKLPNQGRGYRRTGFGRALPRRKTMPMKTPMLPRPTKALSQGKAQTRQICTLIRVI